MLREPPVVRVRPKASAKWTSKGKGKGENPEYLRRSRPSVMKGQRMIVRLSGCVCIKPGGTAGSFLSQQCWDRFFV